jgi:hypothetical protein
MPNVCLQVYVRLIFSAEIGNTFCAREFCPQTARNHGHISFVKARFFITEECLSGPFLNSRCGIESCCGLSGR